MWWLTGKVVSFPQSVVLEPRMTNWGINGEALPDDIPDGKRVFFGATMNQPSMPMTAVKFDGCTRTNQPNHMPRERVLLSWQLIMSHLTLAGFGVLMDLIQLVFFSRLARQGMGISLTPRSLIRPAMLWIFLMNIFRGFNMFLDTTMRLITKSGAEMLLSASKMTVNPSPVGKPNFLCTVKGPDDTELKVQMDDGRFADGTPQSLYFPESHPTLPGHFKGMRQILRERFEHGDNVPNPDRASPKINGQCKDFKCEEGQTDCCLRRIFI